MRAFKVLLFLLASFIGSRAQAAPLDPNFAQTDIPAAGLLATAMAWATDGSDRLFVTTKDGTTRIIQGGVLLQEPFMTVTELYQGSECGLLGIAFDPNFGENGYVYFFLTATVSEQRIVRYRAQGNVGVEPTIIVSGLATVGLNHDGGALAFGPDGKLYWAIGDNGPGVGVNADLTSTASKVGRVNRDGSVPTDNPFHDGSGPNDDRIWARGFRNPFTMTFQPSTGGLWLNVVGTSYEQVFVVGKGDHGGWSTYEAHRPDGFIQPVIHYITNAGRTYALAGVARSGNVATFTTAEPHYLHVGERMTIAAVTDASFNGTAFVTGIPSTTTFTVAQAGPDAMSDAGTASKPHLGGCITGGVFYDSTAASAEYRNNFFFSDLNSGMIMRAKVSGSAVASVEPWANQHGAAVDTSLGPDGDLYVVTHGQLGPHRYRFVATSQYLVVSRTNVWMLEDGVAAFNVRLAVEPTAPVEVRVRPSSARSGVSITSGAALSFGSSDWSAPKIVTLSAARDDNTVDDVTEFTVASSALPIESVRVRILDEYAAVEPPPGGAGGEAGSNGDDGGLGGVAGEGSGGTGAGRGGTAAGGTPTGGTAAGGTATGGSPGDGGTGDLGGAGGEADAGEPATTNDPPAESSSGCGCSMSRRSGGGAAILAVALALLRRRSARRRPLA